MTRAAKAGMARYFPSLRSSPEERIALTPTRIRIELLAGLTVALALVPEAVAFAFVAGVHPLVGLYAAFLVGLITAIAGGRPGMISGATGALAVVMVALVAEHGVEYLFATVVLMGILQLTAGALRLRCRPGRKNVAGLKGAGMLRTWRGVITAVADVSRAFRVRGVAL